MEGEAVGGAVVDTLLAGVAAQDSSAHVRAEAVRSLAMRTLGRSSIELAARIAKMDVDQEVRLAAVLLLGSEFEHDPSLQPVLEDVSRTDREAGVRNGK